MNKVYLAANGTTGFAIFTYKKDGAAQEAFGRVKDWEAPTVEDGTLSATQFYSITQDGSTLTFE